MTWRIVLQVRLGSGFPVHMLHVARAWPANQLASKIITALVAAYDHVDGERLPARPVIALYSDHFDEQHEDLWAREGIRLVEATLETDAPTDLTRPHRRYAVLDSKGRHRARLSSPDEALRFAHALSSTTTELFSVVWLNDFGNPKIYLAEIVAGKVALSTQWSRHQQLRADLLGASPSGGTA